MTLVDAGHHMTKVSLSLMLMAGALLSGCGDSSSSPPANGAGSSSSGNPVTAPVDYLGAVGKAQKSAGKVVASAGLTQAIQMFQGQEGRFPKSLSELVPNYVDKIPAPPAGMKYVYNPADGTLKVAPQ